MSVWAAWHLVPHFVCLPHGPESAIHLAAQPSTKDHCECHRTKDKRDQSFRQKGKKGAAKPPPETQVVDERW